MSCDPIMTSVCSFALSELLVTNGTYCIYIYIYSRARYYSVQVRIELSRRVADFDKTKSSTIAEGPRDASCQLKPCQLPRNSAENYLYDKS